MTIDLLHYRRPAVMAASMALAVSLMGSPARALDDGQENIFTSLLDLAKMGIGFENDKDQPSIEYRERAPLVLPPKMELRQPMPPVANRNPQWPLDQDLARVKKAQAAAAKPRGNDVEADPLPARDLQKYGRVARANEVPVNKGGCDDMDKICDVNTFWGNLAKKKEEDSTKNLVPGVEPTRAHLTEPPRGFRVPTKFVKPTFEPPDRSYQDNLGSGPAQVRQDALRRSQAE